MLAYSAAIDLAAIAAWFSLKGVAVLFPDSPREIVVVGAITEAAKLVVSVASHAADIPWCSNATDRWGWR